MQIGERLRAARIAGGASLFEVGQAIGLPEEVVLTLENSQFDGLGGEARTKALIRLYANFVDVEPENLLFDFDNSRTVSPPVSPDWATTSAAVDDPPYRSRWTPITVTLGILAVVTMVVVAIAQNQRDPGIEQNDIAATQRAAPRELRSERNSRQDPGLPGTIVAGGPLLNSEATPHTEVQLLDGSETADALDEAKSVLERLGHAIVLGGKARQPYRRTVVFFNPGYEEAAWQLTRADSRFGAVQPNDRGLTPDVPLHVVIGQDWAENEADRSPDTAAVR